jgi:formylglycine-generating enzyme required for sulfatase activity
MRTVFAVVLAICSMWFFGQPAFAAKRVALVIGNSAYQTIPALVNPTNDADAVSTMLKDAGFDVVALKRDLKVNDMRRALRSFSDDTRDADLALVYFSGHGVEIDGINYLIPVDAVLERDIDAYDEAIQLDRVLAVMEPARQLRIVIVDACRDNPFKTMKHTAASRGIGRGLSRVEPESPNTLIAFAAKAGTTAADGNDRLSPFTAALVKYLPRPGLDLRKAFGFVRDEVLKATRNRQEPFVYGSLGGGDVALVPAAPVPPQGTGIADPSAAAGRDYELALQINVTSAWDSFISKYPRGFYTDLAIAQRDKLKAAKAAATEEARLAAERNALEQARTAEAERARLAAEAQAARDASAAAERAKEQIKEQAKQQAKAAEAAKAAREREAFEKQKAIEQRAIDEAKAIEEAKASEAAKAADAARAKAAEAAKAASEREAFEKQKALEEAKAADAARAAAVPARNDEAGRITTAALEEGGIGRAPGREEALRSPGCSGNAPDAATLSARPAGPLSQSEECGLKPRAAFKECENCPEMVLVPAGEFMMGSDRDDVDSGLAAANEEPQHKAVIQQPIAVGRFEVTRDQYAAFVKASGYASGDRCYTFENNTPQERDNRSFLNPGFRQEGNHPAVCVSWVNAKAYVEWLSRTTGKPYRLLSETEYEYAARAGSASRYGFGNDPAELCKFANGADQSAKSAGLPASSPYMSCKDGYPFTAPVGSLTANAFGLHDLIGNVWEWTEDCYYGNYAMASLGSAARAEAVCASRTVRGGDWFSTEASLRPAARANAKADAHHDDIGFRVARTLGP